MPTRTITIAIVVFWLGMLAWLMHAEVWPRIQPGQPPSFTMDLMDDTQAMPVPTRWIVVHSYGDDVKVDYSMSSSIAHNSDDDTFELFCRLEPKRGGSQADQFLKMKKLETLYKLRREGTAVRLWRITARFTQLRGVFGEAGPVTGFVGEVDDSLCRFRSEDEDGNLQGESVAVEVTWNGVVLLPLHPLHRIESLRPGQRWGCNLFDPIASTARGEPHLVWVNARVRSQTEVLTWLGQNRVCLVIDYEGDGGAIQCSTWVDTADSRVIKMTARLGDRASWEMIREGT
jgi:hypothetical protein